MTRPDVKSILTGIHENNERLQSCDVHRFPEGLPEGGTGRVKRYRCEKCGGEVDASALLNYCEGFRAAGRNPVEVWPSFEVTKSRLLEVIAKL